MAARNVKLATESEKDQRAREEQQKQSSNPSSATRNCDSGPDNGPGIPIAASLPVEKDVAVAKKITSDKKAATAARTRRYRTR